MVYLYQILGWIMNGCYAFFHNYGIAIIAFTLISKIVLLPISIWVQKNSIKMVKMQPEINFMKVQHFGDKDTIAEEQAKIFKREKYNPLASLIPLILQLILLVGVIGAIKAGINNPDINMDFMGINMSFIPNDHGGWLVLSPIVAGISAWLMCVAQNASNVLQSEQLKWNKYGTLILSVGLSLYLGWFVPIGVAVYWIASNLLAIAQLYLLNCAINPKKYVDYVQLEKSKKDLKELENIGRQKKGLGGGPDGKRERADYKKFFSVVNKHLVFYSEENGFYKYYQGIIEYLLQNTNVVIHYITSDPKDKIFELSKKEEQIKAYYIGEKRLITLMMKLNADIVVMTMPDLENYHIKRSYVRKDIQYIYIPHGMDSLNMSMRKGSMDHFDTVMCTGKHQKEEIEKIETLYQLPKKTLVEWGYSLLDQMREDYNHMKKEKESQKSILIAPSWQKDNIVDSCLEQLLDGLKGEDYRVTVRPHPQHIRHQPEKMEKLKERYVLNENIEIQTDFSSNSTVFGADLVITDWSGIAYEFAYATCKPVLFIDTPMKIMNPEYDRIDVEPINIWMREKIGRIIKLEEVGNAASVIALMLNQTEEYHDKIDAITSEYVYNIGKSSEVGAKYIIEEIQRKISERKGEKMFKKGMKVLTFSGFIGVSSMLLFGLNANAYIDPSVMTYLIQAVAGVVIAVGAIVAIYFRRAKKKLSDKLGIDENRNKEVETDEIVIQDKKGRIMMLKPQFKRRRLFQKRGMWIALGIGIIILAYIMSAYWYQFTLIQGQSMYPAFYDKQLVLLDKHSREYKVNDVIAFYCEGLKRNLLKRIVAVPGDSVMIVDGVLYVNGERSLFNHAEVPIEYGGIAEQEIILKDGQFFVLGDNVAKSKDSRYAEVGIVYTKDIIGKVIVR